MTAPKRGGATGRSDPKPKGQTPKTTLDPVSPKLTQARRRAFLTAFADTGNICRAAAISGIDRKQHYRWMRTDPKYAKAFAHALEMGGDIIEAELHRRAVEGTDRPIYQGGSLVGHERVYSDTLMALLIKRHRPELYRERSETKHSGEVGMRHKGEIVVLPENPFPDAPKQ